MSVGKKKSIETAVGVSVALIVAFLIKQIFFNPSFEQEMIKTAGEMNKNLPVMLDSETRLDSVSALPENIFQYNYTLINISSDSLDIAGFQNYLEPMLINNVKTNPEMKTIKDNNTTLSYNYQDKHGNLIFKIDITADQYND